MKKFLLILILYLLYGISSHVHAQYPRLELTVTAVQESSPGKADAEIHLKVDGERPPYVYQVFDKAPWDGGKEIARTQKTNEPQYVFKNLPSGSYFVCVTDNEENSDCEIIHIKND
jgi:hypothetical protein